MKTISLDTPIEYIKGIGPQRAELLKKELSIFVLSDLLSHYPFRYVDRTRFYSVREVNEELPYVQLKGKIARIEIKGAARQKRLVATFRDESGSIELIWFQGIKWIAPSLKTDIEYVIFGKPGRFKNTYSIIHPELEPVSNENTTLANALQPVYNTSEKLKTRGLDSKGISKLIKFSLNTLLSETPGFNVFPENLPPDLINDFKLISKEDAMKNIHFPANIDLLNKAKVRLKFEELFFIQLRLLKLKVQRQSVSKGFVFSTIGETFNTFFNQYLPFPLTNAQKRVLKEIRSDMGTGKQMNRLLQGDVGSGKTIVALMTMLMAIDNGFQACLMAPTEILANQHFESISSLLKDMNVGVGLLTGSSKTFERRELHTNLEEGRINILIGTHALIEDAVKFKNLGVVIIDEQHRFGVEQRAKLWKKNSYPPHVLVMTATPIPRTLAMTLYGDLDVSVIDELPPGRKPIQTIHKFEAGRLWTFQFIKEQIAKGRQVYIVYPLIKESEKLDYKDLNEGYEAICRVFPLPEYKISIVHGQMKPADKDFEMQRFLKNETHIMVATTVIEVGVNVPNASIMVVESAERFGLSQLHQLRGRVGRGAEQSFCILMTSHKLTSDAKLRMETMVRTNDGFEIADVDLRLRGPGDIEGTQQSGLLDLRIADLSQDAKILQVARQAVQNLLQKDPELTQPEHFKVKQYLNQIQKSRQNWSRIS
jgi:ATP-dependent DNA helicase RecG